MQKPRSKQFEKIGKTLVGVPEVPLDFFLAAILPPLSDSILDIEAELIKRGLIVDGLALNPSLSHGGKDHFADLVQIFDTVVDAAEQVLQRTPNARLLYSVSEAVAGTHTPSPDAQIRLIAPHSDSSSCFATAVPWRIESMRTPTESNEHELLWSCQTVLRDDPCRRFSFGVSLDGAELRMWFFSRAEELVSSPLNCLKEVSALSQVFARLAFATPEQLGYDTTMSRIVDDAGSVQMKITLSENVYITKRLLSDRCTDAVCGRTTRVWEAYSEDDPERTSVAIKDLWTSVDAVQEGSQLLELHDKLRSLADPATPRPAAEYFLTVLDHGFVRTSEGVDDHTMDVMTRGQVPPTDLAHHPRKHYRIVFKEVGTPVHRLRTLSEMMHALADATRALSLLYMLGLVHRDVSPGNILFIDGHGKLTDLEYLKSFRGTHSPQPTGRFIGTADYASGEAALGMYCFVPRPEDIYRPPPRPTFRFNPLHDLESTFWIGLWVLLYHRRCDRDMKGLYDEYFPDYSPGAVDNRLLAISSGKGPRPTLDESDPLSPAMCTLDNLRRALHKFYQAFEGDFANQCLLFDGGAPVHGSVFDRIHSTFIDEYEKTATESDGILLAAPEPSKRKVSGDPGSDSPEEPVANAASPERPAKKHKSTSASPKGPPPTRSSGSRKRRNPTQPSRRSARIAGKSKSSGKRTNPT
ncbi:hypothetical protein C8R47DRAFT_1314324 [Mycena vitilis]|nr:hypothetical protein C8R47DRAFT_1314324 [Mycena vitilis]